MNFYGYEPVEKLSNVIPNGRHQAKIVDAKESSLSSGEKVLKVHIKVKDYPNAVPDTYSIFDCPGDEKKRKVWNFYMTKFFDSFGITRGDWNVAHWVNKYGYVDITQDWNARKNKSYAVIHPVKKDDPPTEDYRPEEKKENYFPMEQGGVVDNGFPEDIPF